jgi:cysteinyl-tRNA synthetase
VDCFASLAMTKESDRIRDELAAMGIALKDNKDGTTTWDVKR